ncbi:BA14K family protein [uncultured Nitratireductor sp.]|uniref:BA14K family protein n=1 Tax=Nitratireductor aquimarinus TaxID=889300 RepID=UPI00262796AA|nr:BA14K family protein [uncultured Nitratireductor sp.]
MKRILKTGILSLAVAATTLGAISTADAGHRNRHRHNNNDAIAAGVLGLAAGAIVGGLLSDSRRGDERVYIDPPRRPRYPDYQPVYRDYYPSAPAYRERPAYRQRPVQYRSSMEPWSREWFRYCSNRYRSFDGRTGTFMGYDGNRHFCQPR